MKLPIVSDVTVLCRAVLADTAACDAVPMDGGGIGGITGASLMTRGPGEGECAGVGVGDGVGGFVGVGDGEG